MEEEEREVWGGGGGGTSSGQKLLIYLNGVAFFKEILEMLETPNLKYQVSANVHTVISQYHQQFNDQV